MLKPWRQIAQPHKDVLEGTFRQSEFAADISMVAAGKASEEYQDPEKFFARTYITEGMRLLLISVAQRLAGTGGDPVIQLQTAFGGGKTHTMLAVYHLACSKVAPVKLHGIPPLLDAANIQALPAAKVAVIDGIKLSPSHPLTHEGLTVNTLWGDLAWQLLGRDGYELVAASDQDGTSPGKEILSTLLHKAAPCVILIDELVAFVRQFESGKQYRAGTFDSNMSFIQALTEAMKAVPNALLLASLPESELEAGGSMGKQALDALEKYFARVESVWKPVATEEAFEIVRRRLFDSTGNTEELDKVCKAFAECYREHGSKFPPETQSSQYYERLRQSYPIHPEIFDRLYEDWSTLEKFQRTRGVLQYMAMVIYRLWNSNDQDLLIMPSSLPLDDSNVRNKSIHYLPQGWEPVLEKEVDGPRSETAQIDGLDTRIGSVQAARRVARTIFLGSAPAGRGQSLRGIKLERILLGTVQPGQAIGLYEDALKRLRDQLHYLYSDKDRYWFDTKPNLRREMESRKQNIALDEEVLPLLRERLTKLFGKQHRFAGVHVFTQSVDIPDDVGQGPRLVVLPTQSAYSRTEAQMVYQTAEEILRKRGEMPRQKQNRLIFLAADYDLKNRLYDQARTYLGWCSIVEDIKQEKLNLDLFQMRLAEQNQQEADRALNQMSRETFKWLLCPSEEFLKGKPTMRWETVNISTTAPNLVQEIESRLREEEWLVTEWAPVHLRNLLQQWYFKDGVTEVSSQKVWQDSCNFLLMPRLLNEQIFRQAIEQGLGSKEYFGYASGKDGENYLGFAFGSGGKTAVDSSSLLISREAAGAYLEAQGAKEQASRLPVTPPIPVGDGSPAVGTSGGSGVGTDDVAPIISPPPISPPPPPVAFRHNFYGSTELDPVKAKVHFATMVDEVLEHFTAQYGTEVNITIEIEAKSGKGFDEGLQRTVKENCKALKFKVVEFE